MIGDNQYRQTDRQAYEYTQMVKLKKQSFCLNDFFSSSKPLHTYFQYVFNEFEKYQNLSTYSSGQVSFTLHATSQLQHLRANKTQ